MTPTLCKLPKCCNDNEQINTNLGCPMCLLTLWVAAVTDIYVILNIHVLLWTMCTHVLVGNKNCGAVFQNEKAVMEHTETRNCGPLLQIVLEIIFLYLFRFTGCKMLKRKCCISVIRLECYCVAMRTDDSVSVRFTIGDLVFP